MKILLTRRRTNAGNYVSDVKEADEYTIANEPIASIDLMERAARAFVNFFESKYSVSYKKIVVLCGLGDNGGDGLAIARMLYHSGFEVEVIVLDYSERKSDNFKTNLGRLVNKMDVRLCKADVDLPLINPDYLYIDALLGAGLSRPLEGILKTLVINLNASAAELVSVDIPSGLFADSPNGSDDVIVKANQTITFQTPKLAFFLPQNAAYVGDWWVVDIGLHDGFISQLNSGYEYTDAPMARQLIKPRNKFSNKGNFGHALMIAGSFGMIGAAVLSSRACLRSGVGKVTVYTPACGYTILQSSVPEAMCLPTDNQKELEDMPPLNNYQAIGIGCGIGTNPGTASMIEAILKNVKVPVVIDADALNIIAADNHQLSLIPAGAVLTPHPKEFQRLIGKTWANDYEKLDLLVAFAVRHQCIVCLKGAFTAIASPDGKIYFNSTGNAGMAKGGSGDVLTGMILALLAQGYTPINASLLGVYEHGLAGDRAAQLKGTTAMIASDIIENIRF